VYLVHERRDTHGGCRFDRFYALAPDDLTRSGGLSAWSKCALGEAIAVHQRIL
tara:strand:+ start:4252 stop:4410 length:159 start_codon:yes stop_codon:yes gene_type:complete